MRFCLEFINDQQNIDSIEYVLTENNFSQRWFNKIKKIYRVPPSLGDSYLDCRLDRSPSRVNELLEKICRVTGTEFKKIDITNQQDLNHAHQNFYENLHKLFVEKRLELDLLYQLHMEIHRTESINSGKEFVNFISVGWAHREGPLIEEHPAQKYYSKQAVKAGNLYARWSELGKLPTIYYRDREPDDQNRFNALSKPNLHHRAKFEIAIMDRELQPFSQDFVDWFTPYKEGWLKHHGLDDWQPHDEQTGVALAEPKTAKDYESFFKIYTKFHRIIL